jgi:peroxiredoxin
VVPDIEKLGASLVAICPQRPEFLKKMVESNALTYPILRDEGNRYAQQLGLRFLFPDYLQKAYLDLKLDLSRVNGDPSWSMPVPARYVVKTDGIIAAADYDLDYTSRPEPLKTIEDLKNIA